MFKRPPCHQILPFQFKLSHDDDADANVDNCAPRYQACTIPAQARRGSLLSMDSGKWLQNGSTYIFKVTVASRQDKRRAATATSVVQLLAHNFTPPTVRVSAMQTPLLLFTV